MHGQLLGEGQGLAGQACAEQAGGQIAAFEVGRAFSQHSDQGLLFAIDRAQFDAFEMPVLITLFNHLEIMPTRLRLGMRRWTTFAGVGWHNTVD